VGPVNAEFLHTRAQRSRLEPKDDGGATSSLDAPSGLLKYLVNVLALDIFEGLASCRGLA
jgi:hypothetical protein